MCCRYYYDIQTPDPKLTAIIEMMERKYPGRYKAGEIFPGDTVPALIERRGKIVAIPAVFGFPGFQNGRLLINARAETAEEKRSFAESMRAQRIILPATGFYEWSRDSDRTKYLFVRESYEVLYLCGLYKIVDGQVRFVILTRAANESMIEIHDRMPIIATEDEVRPYLSDLSSAKAIVTKAAPVLIHELA